MLANQQPVVQMMPLDDIIPALAKIAFNVSHCRPFDDAVGVMPGVQAALLFVVAM